MPDKLKTLLASRKFWALVVAIVTAAGGYATGALPLQEVAQLIVGAIMAYIVGTGIEDARKA